MSNKAAEPAQHQATSADTPEATVLAVPQPTATEQSQQQRQQNPQRKREHQQTSKA